VEKRIFYLVLSTLSAGLLLAFIWFSTVELPKMRSFAIKWLEYQISTVTPYRASIGDLGIRIFPIGVSVSEVSFKPKSFVTSMLPHQINLKYGKIEIGLFDLFKGKVKIEELYLEELQVKLTYQQNKDQTLKLLNLKPLFQITPLLEQTRIVLNKASVQIDSINSEVDAFLKDIDLLIHIEKKQIFTWITIPTAEIKKNDKTFLASCNTQLSFTEDHVEVTSLEVQASDIFLKSYFIAQNLEKILTKPDIEGAIKLHILPKQKNSILSSFGLNISGEAFLDAQFKYKNNILSSKQAKIVTQDFSINQFQIGHVELESQIKNSIWISNLVTLKNQNIHIDLTDTEIDYSSDLGTTNIKSAVKIHTLQIQNLLQNLNLKQVPMWLTISGSGNCQGQLQPKFDLICDANLVGQDLEVKNSISASIPIVKIREFAAQGKVQVNTRMVKYDAKIQAHGSATGTSKGLIDYQNGFNIQYEGTNLDLKKIGPIANLNFEGLGKIKGSTKGTSKSATFAFVAEVDNFKFETLALGNTRADLRYSKGVLSFDNLQSRFGTDTLNGLLKLDLISSQIQLDIATNKVTGDELMQIFDYYLPDNSLSQGDGSIRFSARGPFDWKKWDIQLDFKFFKPLIFNEYIDEVKLQLIVQDQFIKIGQSFASKGPHRILLNGQGHLEKNSQITIDIMNLPLEYIDNISLLSANISGFLNFKGRLINPFGELDWQSEIEITHLMLNDQELPNMRLEYLDNLNLSTFRFLYGTETVKAELKHQKKAQLSSLTVEANNFDARPFFILIGSSALVEDYDSSMSFQFVYQFDSQNPLKGSGSLHVTDLFVSRLGTQLNLKKPTHVTITEGNVPYSAFVLDGSLTQSLALSLEGLLYENLKVSLKSDIELQLLHPFVPIFDDFRGRLAGNMMILGIPSDPKAFGQIRIKKGQFQFKGLPQSLNQVEMKSQFNGKELEILSFSSELGQGMIQGQGKIKYQNVSHIDVLIPISIKNSILEPIDGVRVKTTGYLSLKGSTFPYVLEGNIDVLEGLISKEFEGSETIFVRRSSLLPKIILKRAFDPLTLKVQLSSSRVQLRNNLIEGYASGQVLVTGSPMTPQLKGFVRIQENSRIFFREHSFRVDQGLITLDGSQELNPSLLFTALARIDRFDVTLNVHGTVDSPVIRLSSQPMLPEAELVSLLALGQVTRDVEKRLQAPSSQTQAEAQLGSVLLQNIPLFKKAQKAVGVNVQISSGFDPEQNAEFRRISVSKRLNNKTRLLAATGDYGFREFKLEYLLTDNLSAIGRFKQQDFVPNSINLERQNRADSILGLDLEFRKEFR